MTAGVSRRPLDLANPADRDYALKRAVDGLREDHPLQSASTAVVGWQRPVLWTLLLVIIGCAIWRPTGTAVVLMGLCTLGYVLTMLDRVLIFKEGLASRPITISDEEARAIPDDELPRYTVLVPAYNESEVVADLIGAMSALEYPADELQVLLLLEADDEVTINAAKACTQSEMITTVLVPPANPRTKPKACNYGLYFATGEIITIYDAEDLPEPLQLRRVVGAFRQLPDDIACVQAKLAYHNGHQNMLTAWFTAEYALWFGYLLPGMMRSTSPIPLGGTSNHLRRDVLDKIGSWDPFNVTEDADLGLRIDASGYHTAVVDSTTLEEANSDPINWVRQRSRWYKGYLQTWLVHIRQPVKLFRTLGLRSFVRFNLVLAGTPIIAVLNMLFWLITVLWFLGQPAAVGAVFPWYIYFPALICLILGNAATLYMNLITLREDDRSDFLFPALTVPLFWLMMSIAATKGVYQLIRNPSHWEKIFHGLAQRPSAEPSVEHSAEPAAAT
jgi:cellulose synthase/poly-beta-1,6-N-acetylglucosamine synthase-like glycosyltransferase